MHYSYDRNVKLNAEMEMEEEVFEEKFFYFLRVYEQKNKINF